MSEQELKDKVDKVISMASDDEAAHSMEDELHIEIIKRFCPLWVVDEVNRLSKADFERWCA